MSNSIDAALLNNGFEDFKKVATVLIRIADNILKNGTVEKYRSIRIDSKAFQEKLLPYDGAVQCLLDMGFQEDDDCFTFSHDSSIFRLRTIRDGLSKRLNPQENKSSTPSNIINSQNEVHKSLLQEKARSRIPVSLLRDKAQKQFDRVSRHSDRPSYHHCLILELLAWFKKSFFTWTDAPKCTHCNTTDKPFSIGMLPPSENDLTWWGYRVEGYRCPNCSATLRFPRYNHPEKLLDSRTGRCGEWANCFTLICRAMGFESRHVLDWTDHVWTEVFIPEWERWVHCDPCENTCDRPLIYEQGWKKKLSLVVAASAEELVDVTWRYSINRNDVMSRRVTMFEEGWLLEALERLNRTRSIANTPDRRRVLERRRAAERAQMEKTKDVSGEESLGRTSGSLAWRLARGETHGEGGEIKTCQMGAVEWSDREFKSRLLHFEYSCCRDEYKRISNGNEVVDGWESMTWRSRGMMRKEEFDWKKVYLCRHEGAREGYISWRVLPPAPHLINRVQLRVASDTFESGFVGWLLCSDRKCHVIIPGKTFNFDSEYKNSKQVTLHCFLRGGTGDTAWQKSQLFRESSEEVSTSSMFLQISII